MKAKKLKTWLLIAVASMSASLPLTARSELTEHQKACAADVQIVMDACDRALADQDKVINLKTREIGAYKEVVAAQDTRIASLEKEKGGLFSSPWFYFGIGIVAGALLVRGK